MFSAEQPAREILEGQQAGFRRSSQKGQHIAARKAPIQPLQMILHSSAPCLQDRRRVRPAGLHQRVVGHSQARWRSRWVG